jgi:hypothetical protein
MGVGLLPLAQLAGTLALGRAELADELLKQFVLAVLSGQDFP